MPSSFSDFAAELIKNAAVASLEPKSAPLRTDPAKVAAITKTVRGLDHDELRAFARAKGRHDFLWAAAKYLAPLPHEELLVAFGSRRGASRNAGACLRQVHRTIGERDRVDFTPKLIALLDKTLEQDGAEVILIHNHPSALWKTFIGETIGWRPIASTQDRALATRLLETRLGHFFTSSRPSSLKWYLVDEGKIAEFLLPPAETLLGWLSSAKRQQ
jgi:hypothetical protein